MPLKSLLVAFSGDPDSCTALRLAMRLQREHAAHLTGVVWHGPEPVDRRHRAFVSRGVSEMLTSRDASATAAVRADFTERVARDGDATRATFIDLHETEDRSLSERARSYDLVVMSRHAAELGREHAWARPDVVALKSGRPVITVPDGYAGERVGARVVLAWDGKRAAARALGDLLHVLGVGGRLTVLTVGEAAAPEAGDDVAALVARHGATAERLVRPAGRRGIRRTILDACAETGADLLVMGAYEHSKLAEDLLGGVTRDILAEAALPVMMSH
jgi:nucleotide-binding universal stress UspA family protein